MQMGFQQWWYSEIFIEQQISILEGFLSNDAENPALQSQE